MSGICGIVFKKNIPAEHGKTLISNMVAKLAHRGPDSSNTYIDENNGVFLAYTHLAIIDLSTKAQQPFINETRSLVTIVDGRIYNYPELRHSLLQKGHVFKSASDLEVILHLFEVEKWRTWQLLRGMYASVIYNIQEKNVLLVRDPLGMKPLYLYENDKLFAFSSEIQAFNVLEDELQLNIDAIVDFLLIGCIPPPATHLKNIRTIMPGQYAIISNSSVWFSNPTTAYELCNTANETPAPTPVELSECLRDSVKRHLVSDVPIGLFLSGGIDSGSIASLASADNTNLRAVTVTLPGNAQDESQHARLTASAFGIQLTEIPLVQSDFENNLPLFLNFLDMPSVDGFNTFIVSKLARQAGLKVALSGLGGDEFFGGYTTFWWTPFFSYVGMLTNILGRFSRKISALTLELCNHTSGGQRVAEIIRMKASDPRLAYLSFRGLFVGKYLAELIVPDGSTAAKKATERFLESTSWILNSTMPLKLSVAGLEIQNYMGPMLLRDTDVASMAHSLEVRTPFVDIEVVKYVLPLLKMPLTDTADHSPKLRLRQALPKPLPNEIVRKKKQTFTLPWQKWLKGKILSEIDEMLLMNNSAEWKEIINPSGFKRWRDAYVAGRAHWRCIWALYVLVTFLISRHGNPNIVTTKLQKLTTRST